jgi:hypothetical protein
MRIELTTLLVERYFHPPMSANSGVNSPRDVRKITRKEKGQSGFSEKINALA